MRAPFRAMGTSMALIGPGDADPAAFATTAHRVEAVFAEHEQRFSRFLPDSELCRVNTRQTTRVSAAFAQVTRLALAAATRTGGLFDPTTLVALEAAGYDRDIEVVRLDPRVTPLADPRSCGRWDEVSLRGRTIDLPEGVALDFGGIAKGWTADRAAEEAARLLPWALVDAGGDLRLTGDAPREGLPIDIEDPFGGDMPSLQLHHGALATSSTRKRRWGDGRHHLIDPRTGRPSATDFVQVTAWAPTCVEAEVSAKWVLLGGNGVLDAVSAIAMRSSGDLVMNLEAA